MWSRPGRIVVLGMHRSGTSAITRAINLLGFPLGATDDLHQGWDNPQGHWESSALIDCNERILASLHGAWDMPPPHRAGWADSPTATAMLPDLRAAFTEVYGGLDERWLWKDPRICITFPLWRRVLRDPTVVIVLREPHAVASSLHVRESMRPSYSVALWERYSAAAVHVSAGLPAVVVRYVDAVRDPLGAMEALASNLESLGIAVRGDIGAAAASIDRGDRAPDPTVPLSGSLARLWAALQSLPRVTDSLQVPLVVDDMLSHHDWRFTRRLRVVAARPVRAGLFPRLRSSFMPDARPSRVQS
jgi:hypothetical protein